MPMRDISADELTDLKETGFSLLQFYATWCGPCKLLKLEIDKILEEQPEINVLRFDIDEDLNLAKSFGIRGVPALFILKGNQVLDKKTGFIPKETIQNWIHSELEWEGK
jgi:thioredoxin 1